VIELKIDTVTIAGNIIESICVVTPAGKPDDVYYEKYGKMRKLLTRGFNIIKINGEVVKRFVGAPKGGNKDIACYCNGDKDAPFVAELFSIKENGQCSRFASCTWNVNGVSTCFLLIGSKKVACIVRVEHISADLQLYKSDDTNNRFNVCLSVGAQLLNTYGERLASIVTTFNPEYTYNAESCRNDDQHITVYEEDVLIFFGVVTYDNEHGVKVIDPARPRSTSPLSDFPSSLMRSPMMQLLL
jgi:hypothetical protein